MKSAAAARAKRGALFLLTACFLASAVLRAVIAYPAFAAGLAAPAVDAEVAGCSPADDLLLEAVKTRGEELDGREREIAERMALLELAEQEIAQKQAALAAAEEQLTKTLALADTAAEDDIAQLTAIYENVKPKQAAGIFATMDITFAAGILGRMSAPKAAEILALLDADQAYAISVLMAARNVNAGGPVPPAD